MAADGHCDPLGDAGPNHVADAASSQIVNEEPVESCRRARVEPRLSEVADGLGVAVKDEWTIETAGGCRACDDLEQFALELESPSVPVL